ncbi:hypothetical protein Ahy_B06g084338 [Arachis hypogaea]|uniref:Uncharacterized protein n=1 Tax=Arachis hypogaea TaxID=3818 RepID=A0A444YRP2_ARAHY|nr:hypothetical protein Ahy_B06g084338 [Arachis hypogaea]
MIAGPTKKELKARGINNEHTLAYQSRVGPVQWLKPYTDETLVELGQKGVMSLLAVPVSPSFITDLADIVIEALPSEKQCMHLPALLKKSMTHLGKKNRNKRRKGQGSGVMEVEGVLRVGSKWQRQKMEGGDTIVDVFVVLIFHHGGDTGINVIQDNKMKNADTDEYYIYFDHSIDEFEIVENVGNQSESPILIEILVELQTFSFDNGYESTEDEPYKPS